MIAQLEGKLIEKSPSSVVITAGGVGYQVSVPLTTFDKLPATGEQVSLFTYLHVREDILQLYGFSSREERATFEKMISVSGVGPRLALAILGGLSVEQLIAAVETSQTAYLNRIPGVGKKTAERIVLELKGKLGEMVALAEISVPGAFEPEGREAVAALVSLGFSKTQAEKAVFKVLEAESDKLDITELVRRALAGM